MPQLPQNGETDFVFSAFFLDKYHKDLGMVANFVNPVHTITFPMSALFAGYGNTSLQMRGTFAHTTSLLQSATFFNPTSIANLPFYAHFYDTSAHNDLVYNAIFFRTTSLLTSAIFYQTGRFNLTQHANFQYIKNLTQTATFFQSGASTIRMRAFLGTYKTDLAMTATFLASGISDFPASIQIESYVAPHSITFPGTQDLIMSATIVGVPLKDFLFHAYFGGALSNDFKATIQIMNSYFGVGNVPVSATGPTTITVITDPSGYFYIGNLIPGTYIIVPEDASLTFSPSSIEVTITNENVTLYFFADGQFANDTLTPVPLPTNTSGNCIINPNNNTTGFSIDGFVMPSDYLNIPSILVTAANYEDAKAFQQTFGRNVGGGI